MADLIYPPMDSRAIAFAHLGLEHISGMPLVSDAFVVPSRPQGGFKAMKEHYNSRSPMTAVFDHVWLVSSKNAAFKADVLFENGNYNEHGSLFRHSIHCVGMGGRRDEPGQDNL